MTIQHQDVLNFDRFKANSVATATASQLHAAAQHLAQQPFSRPRLKTKDVVGYLLSHGARAWRASFPVAHPRVKAITPKGLLAVKIKFGSP